MAVPSMSEGKKYRDGLNAISEKIEAASVAKGLSDLESVIGLGRAVGVQVCVRGVDVDAAMTQGCEAEVCEIVKAPVLWRKTPDEQGKWRIDIGHFAKKKGSGLGKASVGLAAPRDVPMYVPGCVGSFGFRDWSVNDSGTGLTNMTVAATDTRTIHSELVKMGALSNVAHLKDSCTGEWLSRMSEGDDYTALFVKMVLHAKAASLAYSCDKEPKAVVTGLSTAIVPMAFNRMFVEYHTKLSRCVINADIFNIDECSLIASASEEWPSITYLRGGLRNIYCAVKVAATPVSLVTLRGRKAALAVPACGPEELWERIYGIAERLGAVGDLVAAYRMVLGLPHLCNAASVILQSPMDLTLDCSTPRGIRSVLAGSGLYRHNRIQARSNMMSLTAWLVADAIVGNEMFSCYHYAVESVGASNPKIYNGPWNEDFSADHIRSAFILWGVFNVGEDDMMRKMWRYYARHPCPPICPEANMQMLVTWPSVVHGAVYSEDEDVKRDMTAVMDTYLSLCGAPLFKQSSPSNSTRVVGKEFVASQAKIGALSTDIIEVNDNIAWLTIHGAARKQWCVNGLAAAGCGVVPIESEHLAKFQHCHSIFYIESSDITVPNYENRTSRYAHEAIGFYRDTPYVSRGAAGALLGPKIVAAIGQVSALGIKSGQAPDVASQTSGMVSVAPGAEKLGGQEASGKPVEGPSGAGGSTMDQWASEKTLGPMASIDSYRDAASSNGAVWYSVPGDGMCAAHAIVDQLKHQGHSVSTEAVIDALRSYERDIGSTLQDNFSLHSVSQYAINHGLKAVISGVDLGEAEVVHPEVSGPAMVVALWNNHWYSLRPSTGNPVSIPGLPRKTQVVNITEAAKARAAVQGIPDAPNAEADLSLVDAVATPQVEPPRTRSGSVKGAKEGEK